MVRVAITQVNSKWKRKGQQRYSKKREREKIPNDRMRDRRKNKKKKQRETHSEQKMKKIGFYEPCNMYGLHSNFMFI